MSSTARMDRARLEQFNRFWEELLQAVPDARRQAVEEAGAAVQRELNAQIGAAELADGAKGTVCLLYTSTKPKVESEIVKDNLTVAAPPGAVILSAPPPVRNEFGEFVMLKYYLPIKKKEEKKGSRPPRRRKKE